MELARRVLDAILGFCGALRVRHKILRSSAVTRPIVSVKLRIGTGQAPPLTWKECHPRTRAIFKAELTCSHGHIISLRSHSIAADGRVRPSVICMSPGCDFHDVVTLEGWTAGVV